MAKIDIIEACGDCSIRYYEGEILHCGKTHECVDECSIPECCPLPDAFDYQETNRTKQ